MKSIEKISPSGYSSVNEKTMFLITSSRLEKFVEIFEILGKCDFGEG